MSNLSLDLSNLLSTFFSSCSYYGYWYGDDVADVGNIHFYAFRDNLVLELALAGEIAPPTGHSF